MPLGPRHGFRPGFGKGRLRGTALGDGRPAPHHRVPRPGDGPAPGRPEPFARRPRRREQTRGESARDVGAAGGALSSSPGCGFSGGEWSPPGSARPLGTHCPRGRGNRRQHVPAAEPGQEWGRILVPGTELQTPRPCSVPLGLARRCSVPGGWGSSRLCWLRVVFHQRDLCGGRDGHLLSCEDQALALRGHEYSPRRPGAEDVVRFRTCDNNHAAAPPRQALLGNLSSDSGQMDREHLGPRPRVQAGRRQSRRQAGRQVGSPPAPPWSLSAASRSGPSCARRTPVTPHLPAAPRVPTASPGPSPAGARGPHLRACPEPPEGTLPHLDAPQPPCSGRRGAS